MNILAVQVESLAPWVAAKGTCAEAAEGRVGLAAQSHHDDAARALPDRCSPEGLRREAQDHVTTADTRLVNGDAVADLGLAALSLGAPEQTTASTGTPALLLPSVGPGTVGLGPGGTW
jgi:hypothetical protein